MSVERSHSTLVFFKAVCHANDGAEKDFLGPTLHEKCPIRGFVWFAFCYICKLFYDKMINIIRSSKKNYRNFLGSLISNYICYAQHLHIHLYNDNDL